MRNLIIAYDISHDKRRTKVFKTLEGYGVPVQFSVFDCEISEENLIKLLYKVESLINKKEDSVILPDLCPRCHGKIKRLGVNKGNLPQSVVVI